MTRRQIKPGDGDPLHGTPEGYRNQRCRCARCTEAQRVAINEWRAANRAKINAYNRRWRAERKLKSEAATADTNNEQET